MAKPELLCWKCGASLADVLLPFSRLSKCKSCKCDLQVCRMCSYFDTKVSNSCREPIAEQVSDKTRANFCGYFQPSDSAYREQNDSNSASKASLESLFGLEQGTAKLSSTDANEAKSELDTLFGLDDKK
jgi:hypothetical protein